MKARSLQVLTTQGTLLSRDQHSSKEGVPHRHSSLTACSVADKLSIDRDESISSAGAPMLHMALTV